MDFRSIDTGKWHKVGTIVIKEPPLISDGNLSKRSYSDCHVKFTDGWCLIEVRETDGEGSVNVYPVDQVAAAINVHEADPSDASVHVF